MKWLLFLLGLILVLVAAAGFVASLDLLTTELGVLYATSAAMALAAGLVIIAIGMLTHRVDALRATILRAHFGAPPPEGEVGPPPPFDDPPAAVDATIEPEPAEFLEEEEEESAPINENRAGALPSLATIGHAPEPPPAPSLVGSYSAGGASYKIFSDGSIEAETDQGAFRFASMSDFKAYIAAKRPG